MKAPTASLASMKPAAVSSGTGPAVDEMPTGTNSAMPRQE
jgi:hypothetical protein